MGNKNNKIRAQIDPIIEELKQLGIKHDDNYEIVGIGDVVESVLSKFGVTEESFKNFFNLSECNCTERKEWLNGLLSWRKH